MTRGRGLAKRGVPLAKPRLPCPKHKILLHLNVVWDKIFVRGDVLKWLRKEKRKTVKLI